jgi:hypothetical protein
MGCSIINDTIQLHVEGSDKNMDVLVQRDAKTKITAGTGLQNPDISKMSLSAMIRRVRQDATGTAVSGQKNYWSAFMERARSRCANANTVETV